MTRGSTRPPLERLIGYTPAPEVLATLPERERQAVELRFGLLDGRIRTLAEVGSSFGVTRERARQLVVAGLRKLRHHSRKSLGRSIG